jgi:predicted MPP superfamily phosphohydrolase
MIFAALAVIAAILIYGVFIEPNWIEIKRAKIINDRLASTIGHLKVIHLSDLHINTIGYREKKAVKILNSLCPDIIFVTGDLKAFKAGFGPVSDFLNQVSAKLGIWAVFGNSDYRKENGEETLGEELNSGEIKKLNGQPIIEETSEKSKFDKAIQYWQKLPVPVTKILGPMIRKHIGL